MRLKTAAATAPALQLPTTSRSGPLRAIAGKGAASQRRSPRSRWRRAPRCIAARPARPHRLAVRCHGQRRGEAEATAQMTAAQQSAKTGPSRPRGAGAPAAGESHRHSRAREPAGPRRRGRSGARRHSRPVRRRQQVQPRKTSCLFELRQAPHQGRDPRQPAPARLGLARHAPPPQAGGSRHARTGRHAAAQSDRSRKSRRSWAWIRNAGAA